MNRNWGLYIDGKPVHRGASANGPALRDEQPSTQLDNDGGRTPVAPRGGRFSESQPAVSPSFRSGGAYHVRSRLTSHASNSLGDSEEVAAKVFVALVCASPLLIFGASYLVIRFLS